jgi:hypothetical protein
MNMLYAGIGARSAPDAILNLMTQIAAKLSTDNYILRSGGAIGADTAFEDGATEKEIYFKEDATEAAMEFAASLDSDWDNRKEYAQRLHARNAMILLGGDLTTPVKFVICWTPGGNEVGGTGVAIRMAKSKNIPIFNLYKFEDAARINEYLGLNKKATKNLL